MSFDTIAQEALDLCKLAYPEFNKKSVCVCPCSPETEHNCSSYWSEGWRSYFIFVDLATKKQVEAPQQSAFDKKVEGLDRVLLPKGVVIVVHHYMGVRENYSIIIRSDDLNPTMLPASVELTIDEKKCLYYTRSLKNSYAGESDIRRKHSGMSVEQWKATQNILQSRGLLNKAGALTLEGKNVARNLKERFV